MNTCGVDKYVTNDDNEKKEEQWLRTPMPIALKERHIDKAYNYSLSFTNRQQIYCSVPNLITGIRIL